MTKLAIGARSIPQLHHFDVRRRGLVSLMRQTRTIQERVLDLLDEASVKALSRTTRTLLCLFHTSPFVHVMTWYTPVQSSLLSFLDIKDIIHLSRTTRRLSDLFNTVIRIRGNIDPVLERYLTSPAEFRNVQARTDALIGPNFAYEFFTHIHTVKLDAHLRVLVEQGKPHVDMTTYLRKDGWEKVEPSEVNEETPEDGWTVRKRIAPSMSID
jgi:hypothetical protein